MYVGKLIWIQQATDSGYTRPGAKDDTRGRKDELHKTVCDYS